MALPTQAAPWRTWSQSIARALHVLELRQPLGYFRAAKQFDERALVVILEPDRVVALVRAALCVDRQLTMPSPMRDDSEPTPAPGHEVVQHADARKLDLLHPAHGDMMAQRADASEAPAARERRAPAAPQRNASTPWDGQLAG